tara:strand:+ start:7644 stop:9131 length:1488 start_codon:yes stop_codon:yes gene_type:complete
MERVAPRNVMYENQLPLAIASKSQRRIFFPEGPAAFSYQGGAKSNIIRIPINADSMLDAQNSYLQFTLKNNSGANTIGTDIGVPIIERLRIESAGVTLEDIQSYNKLYGGVLLPCQASLGAVKDATLTQMGLSSTINGLSAVSAFTAHNATTLVNGGQAIGATNGGNEAANIVTAVSEAINALRTQAGGLNARTQTSFLGSHQKNDEIGAGAKKVFNVPLVSALLNLDKYLPLVFMNAGLVLELHLSLPNSVGVCSAGADNDWDVEDVRYIAHLIDLEREFYDRLRMVMETSGTNLQLTGTTFRSFRQTEPGNATAPYNINIPARIKSIKSIFFTHTINSERYAQQRFGIGCALSNGVSEYQFRVGPMLYPSTSVKVNLNNKGEAYQELRKAFGNINDYQHGGALIDDSTYYSVANQVGAQAGEVPRLTPYALDFESFPRTALENGINTADRSLPITLEIKREHTGNGGAVDVDVFVMCDAVFYVNTDGSVSVSI